MEEEKNNEVQNDHSCCDHSDKHFKHCCSKHFAMHMFIKLVIIVIILLIGICIGTGIARHENKGFYGKDFRGYGNCQMMRGENGKGILQERVIVPVDTNTQTTSTPIKK
jgi:hypothetical protein